MPSSDGLAREEFKYYVNPGGVAVLRQSIKQVMALDRHATGRTKTYKVSSLYFDTPFSTDLNDKLAGVPVRKKYRLRIYDGRTDVIRFEVKRKINEAILKKSTGLSLDVAQAVADGNYRDLETNGNKFLAFSCAEMTSRGYRPAVIVEYDREAYTLPYGNIRVTFDLNTRTYNAHTNLFDLRGATIPLFLNNLQVVEVKYSIPLPTFLKKILCTVSADRSAVSKYVLSQRYKTTLYWSDSIHGR